MKNLSPLCSVVLLETLKSSAVRFITSHPGLSYVFEQEVRPAPLRVLQTTLPERSCHTV